MKITETIGRRIYWMGVNKMLSGIVQSIRVLEDYKTGAKTRVCSVLLENGKFVEVQARSIRKVD